MELEVKRGGSRGEEGLELEVKRGGARGEVGGARGEEGWNKTQQQVCCLYTIDE